MNLSAQQILSELDKDTDPINEDALARDNTVEENNTPPINPNNIDPAEECDAAVAKIFAEARDSIFDLSRRTQEHGGCSGISE
jgi:hypothetical protein